MQGEKLSIGLKATLAIVSLALLAVPAWAGEGTEKVLHNFNPHQGAHPSSVMLGPDGNIYGITVIGGTYGAGTVYELTPAAGGRWLETKVLEFGAKGPYPNLVMFDAEGNLFGTSELGPTGCGAIFELKLDSAGHWRETVLHDFSCAEGLYPESVLVRDGAGNLYGTAWGGGASGDGTVFELSPAGSGWSFRCSIPLTAPTGLICRRLWPLMPAAIYTAPPFVAAVLRER